VKRVIDPLLKFCAERGDLLDRMTDAAKQYAAAANELAKRMGVLPGPEYRRARDEVENLRLEAERARERYRKHRSEHGC
jgi:hypothetical protein